MTLDNERFQAVKGVRQWLVSILKGEMCFPTGEKKGRDLAYRMVKHYPEDWYIDDLEGIMEDYVRDGKV